MGTEKNTGPIAEFFKFNAQNTDWRAETTGGYNDIFNNGLYRSREPRHLI